MQITKFSDFLRTQIKSTGRAGRVAIPKDAVKSELLGGFFGVGMLQIFQTAFGLAASVMLARNLSVDDFGLYTYAYGVSMFLALVASLGAPQLLVREVARYDQKGEYSRLRGVVRRAHQVTLSVAICLGGALLLIAAWQNTPHADVQWLLFGIGVAIVPIVSVAQIRAGALHGLRKVVHAKACDLLVRPLVFLLFIGSVAAFGSLSPIAALIGQIIAAACGFLFVTWFLRQALRHRGELIEYDDRRWGRAVGPFSAIAIAGYLNSEFFVPLVGILAPPSEVAYFRVSLQWALLVALPLTLVEALTHPHVSRLFAVKEYAAVFRMTSRAGWLALALSLPVVVGLAIFAEDLLRFVYGEAYGAAYVPMLLLAAGFSLSNIVGPSMQLLHATDFEVDALVISLVSVILIGAMSIFLIPAYGATGAAAVFAVAKAFRAVTFRLWAQYRLTRAHLGEGADGLQS